MEEESTQSTTAARRDALARATALARRAGDLRRAQAELQELTAREVQVMAKAAASFFEAIPLPEFSSALLPTSARALRRMRHRILNRTVSTTATGTMIHAMLLGRDGQLRLFSARTADTRDLLLSLEPGRALPPTVIRDVVDWTPLLRVEGFRPFEVLEKLSVSLDSVEEQIAEAEEKVQVQRQALASGDLKALLPNTSAPRKRKAQLPAVVPTPVEPADGFEELVLGTGELSADEEEPTAPEPARPKTPFDLFDTVEKVAASVRTPAPDATPTATPEVSSRYAIDDEPEEWDDPEPWDDSPVASAQPPQSQVSAAPRLSLFPIMPPPH